MVHCWAHAARELVAFSAGDSLDLALVLVRKRCVEEVLPWGAHPQHVAHQALHRLQAAWVTDCDLDSDANVASHGCEDTALQAFRAAEAVLAGSPPGERRLGLRPRLEIWSLRPASTFQAPSEDVQVCLQGMKAHGVSITVIGVGAQLPRWGPAKEEEEDEERDEGDDEAEEECAALGALDVRYVAPAKCDVLRHMRRHLCRSITLHLYLPSEDAAFEGLQQARPCTRMRLVQAVGLPSILMLPEQANSAVAPNTSFEFRFNRFIDVGLEVYHTYGVPLVVSAAPDIGAPSEHHAGRLRERLGARDPGKALAAFGDFISELKRNNLAAAFTSNLCPYDHSMGGRSFFFIAFPGSPQSLIFQGLVSYDTASASFPSQPLAKPAVQDHEGEHIPEKGDTGHASSRTSGGGETALNFDAWDREDVYNPLAFCSARPLRDALAEASLERTPLVVQQQAPNVARARGRGRPRRGGGSAAAQGAAAAAAAVANCWPKAPIASAWPPGGFPPEALPLGAPVPSGLQAQCQPPPVAVPAETTPSLLREGPPPPPPAAAGLAQLLEQRYPRKRRLLEEPTCPAAPLAPLGERAGCQGGVRGAALTVGDVQSIAAGRFDFCF